MLFSDDGERIVIDTSRYCNADFVIPNLLFLGWSIYSFVTHQKFISAFFITALLLLVANFMLTISMILTPKCVEISEKNEEVCLIYKLLWLDWTKKYPAKRWDSVKASILSARGSAFYEVLFTRCF
jgi:hypothetical protein